MEAEVPLLGLAVGDGAIVLVMFSLSGDGMKFSILQGWPFTGTLAKANKLLLLCCGSGLWFFCLVFVYTHWYF